MRRRRREATVSGSNSPKIHRRENKISIVHIKLVMLTQPRYISAVSFFSCCGSAVALPALADRNDHVAKTHISQLRPPIPSELSTVLTARAS
jgi:hypothetical protein